MVKARNFLSNPTTQVLGGLALAMASAIGTVINIRVENSIADEVIPRTASESDVKLAKEIVRDYEGRITEIVRVGDIDLEIPLPPQDRRRWKDAAETINQDQELLRKRRDYSGEVALENSIKLPLGNSLDRTWVLIGLAYSSLIPIAVGMFRRTVKPTSQPETSTQTA